MSAFAGLGTGLAAFCEGCLVRVCGGPPFCCTRLCMWVKYHSKLSKQVPGSKEEHNLQEKGVAG